MMALHSCEGPLSRRVHGTLVADVIKAAARVWEVEAAHVLAERTIRQFSHPRLAVYWIAHVVLDRSSPQIGDILGRDHSTVLSGVATAQQLCTRDAAFRVRMLATLQALGLPETDLPNLKGVN
jgi:chromosomal replication initiation ATPase DnaA